MIVSSDYSSILLDEGNIVAFIEGERLSRKKDHKSTEYGRAWCIKIAEALGCSQNIPSPFNCSHHLNHAVSAYIQSPFEDASILVMDGADNDQKYSIGIFSARGSDIKTNTIYPSDYSLGILYTAATIFSGLSSNPSDRSKVGKLMGLASWCKTSFDGSPPYLLVSPDSGEVDSISMNHHGIERVFFDRFGLHPGDPFTLDFKYAEVAGYIQHLFEQSVFSLLDYMRKNLPSRNLIISGGCGLNCVMNGKILRSKHWNNFYVPPLCEDAGNILGYCYSSGLLNAPKKTLVYNSFRYRLPKHIPHQETSYEEVALSIKRGDILAWFDGGSEYGPRALGHRSLLAHPKYPWMANQMNKIKDREYWRPLAPIVLDTHFSTIFNLQGRKVQDLHKYMLATEYLNSEYAQKYSSIAAPDGSSRPQVIMAGNKETESLYSLMRDYDLPILMNTSMNGKNEPICETVEEAYTFCLKAGIGLIFSSEGKLYKIKISSVDDRRAYDLH